VPKSSLLANQENKQKSRKKREKTKKNKEKAKQHAAVSFYFLYIFFCSDFFFKCFI